MIIGIGCNSKLIKMGCSQLLLMMIVGHVKPPNHVLCKSICYFFFLLAQIPSYVVSSWNINALLVGDTRRLSTDIFQPFVGYMSDLIFNDDYLFESLNKRKMFAFRYDSQHIVIGYRIAFFNFVTIDTQKSYIAFSERENQNKNHGKLDIYFLFRSYVPDGIILYRYAQGLDEYFAIGLRAGILALFIDFGYGKRQIVSDESTK